MIAGLQILITQSLLLRTFPSPLEFVVADESTESAVVEQPTAAVVVSLVVP